MPETKIGSSDLRRLVRELYTKQVAMAASGTAILGPILPLIYYPWQLRLGRKAADYLKAGVDAAGERIDALRDRVNESEMVNYWKDFIRGMPEYSALVRAKKFTEIENILTTLARQNEVLRRQEASIRELRRAVEELHNES
jgi:hypothetical protein